MTKPKKLIEVGMPIKEISAGSERFDMASYF